MLNWKFLLFYGIAINSMWFISGSPLARDIADQSLIQLSEAREQMVQITGPNDINEEKENLGVVDLRPSVAKTSPETAKTFPKLISASQISVNLPLFDARVDSQLPSNCAEATAVTQRSGYYYIKISQLANQIVLVECDAHTEGGDWTVIQRRHDGSVDFYLNWTDYKVGFGAIDGEFFIGMDKLHVLTNFDGPQELLISMETIKSESAYAKYDSFVIGNETEKYALKKLGKYSGTAGDSLTYHLGAPFTTKDKANDGIGCAVIYKGAWWYHNCYSSNLNGVYGIDDVTGIRWNDLPNRTLKTVKMMIRRRRY